MAGTRTNRPKSRQSTTPKATYDLEQVRFSALGRWLDIFTSPHLGGLNDSFLSGQHGPCPKCGGTDRFRLVDEREGILLCNQCLPRKNGDGFSALQWLTGWDFPTTLRAVAEYLLVEPNAPSTSRRGARGAKRGSKKHRTNADPAEHLAFKDQSPSPPTYTPTYLTLFRRNKAPITREALEASGARQATYRGKHTVFALPIYGAELSAAPPVGWAMYEATGGTLPVFKGSKIVDNVKVKLTYGTQEGLLGPGIGQLAALQEKFGQVDRSTTESVFNAGQGLFIWKTEGPSDAMALWSAIQSSLPESDRSSHLVVSNSNGAGQRLGPELASLLAVSLSPVIIIPDADLPGLHGARRQAAEVAEAMRAVAPPDYSGDMPVFVLQLPYPIDADHGKDVRDYLNDGHTFEDLRALLAPGSAERASKKNVARWKREDEEWQAARRGGGGTSADNRGAAAALDGAGRRSAAPDGSTSPNGPSSMISARVDETSPGNWSDTPNSPIPHSAPTPLEADDDPHRLARIFLAQANGAGRNLRYWRQQWYRWDGRSYREVPIDLIRGVIIRAVKSEFDRLNLEKIAALAASGDADEPPFAQKVTIPLTNNVLAVLSSFCALGPHVDLNRWIEDSGAASQRSLIALDNGLLDVEAVLNSKEDDPVSSVLLPHSPNWFSTSHLPYQFDPIAECPRWESFVAWAMDGDEERISLLQEWAGYLLLPDSSFQKFLVMEGEGANGKSAFCAAMVALLGEKNVSHVPLEKFGDRFALFETVGKLANIIGDVGELEKTEEGFLKSFTSGDRMTFDRKFLASVDAIPTARLMLSANNRPRFSDRSTGLWRRMMVIPFTSTVAEEDKILGMDKPKHWQQSGELPGILNWALLGLHRLRARGRFTDSEVATAALAEYRLDSNPAALFLEDHYEEAPDEQFVVTKDVYTTYKKWCYENGYHPMSDRNFGKELKRMFPKSDRRQKGPRGDRFWIYSGVITSAPQF